MRDVTILMGSQQGLPAEMLAALAEAGVRVDAGCLFPRVEGRVAHVAVEDDQMDVVRAVAGRHGVTVADDRECLRVPADTTAGPPRWRNGSRRPGSPSMWPISV